MRKLAFALSLVLIFTIPWEDAITIAGISSLTRYTGIFVTALWVISVIGRGTVRKPNLFHLFFALFVLWNITSLLWTYAIDESIRQIKTYIQLLILTWILWDLYKTKKALDKAIQIYVLGAYVLIIATIINYSLGLEIKLYSGGRYAGVGNAVELALLLTLGLPLAWHLATSLGKQDKVVRIINYAYIPAALFAIILSGTRMALFALIPALAYMLGTITRLQPFLRLTVICSLSGALFWLEPLIPRSTMERLGTTFNSITAGDLGGRVILWQQSISFFSENPFFGIGSGALNSPIILGELAHNTFMSVLAEVGLIGFILFSCILFITFHQALQQKKDYAILWITIFLIWVIGVFTLTWEYRKATWFFLVLVVIGANIIKGQIIKENEKLAFWHES